MASWGRPLGVIPVFVRLGFAVRRSLGVAGQPPVVVVRQLFEEPGRRREGHRARRRCRPRARSP